MARLSILFADDQIPDESIPDGDLKRVLAERNPSWRPGFINAFLAMRQVVKVLRNAGYGVTVAYTYRDALELIRTKHFDMAIVDLGWFADSALAPDQQEYAGWDICAAIDEANKARGVGSTLQIIHSNRFDEDATLAMQAADMGKLPVFKSYTEANRQALRAAVKFIETQLRNRPPQQPASQAPPGSVDRWQFYNNLLKYFNNSELDAICFNLGIDKENLGGDDKPARARELIQYCERNSMFEQLVAVCKEMRPQSM
jgi:hypothetical protein